MSQPSTPAPPTDAGGSAETEIEVLTAKGRRERRPRTALRSYDFRQSGFLTPSELRRIRLRHDQFIRSLAARLAIFLRLEISVQLSKLQIITYQKFLETLPGQTHITLFRTDPLKGVGLLVIPPRLSLGLVDRLLGGPGQMPATCRDLSEIEIALTDQIAMLLLSEWCNHWPEMPDLRPTLLGHENNSRFLQAASPETAMLILNMDAGFADQIEPVQLVFPYATVEPLMRQLSPSLPETGSTQTPCGKIQWNAQFDEVKVTARAQWQGLKISAGEISHLKPGDVLQLAPECASQVQLRLSHAPGFLGRPGMCGNKWAVQLTALLNEPTNA